MPLLDSAHVAERLKMAPGWQLDGEEIVRQFSFEGFDQAMEFVNRVARKAQAAGHHPDIDIRYNKVRLGLVSHDAGGLTERDFELAAACNALFV